MTVEQSVKISLEVACDYETCSQFAFPLHKQLSKGYETCSVLPVPFSLQEWRDEHRTARKRASRAERLGYHFNEIQRELYIEDIFEINTSLAERQGRRMTPAYRERQNFVALPDYPCPRHAIRTYGVASARGRLVAYLWLYRAGDLALVSSILGHGEHLQDDIMYLLAQGVIEAEIPYAGFLVYNRHDSGTDGLRYYKDKIGFEPMEVEWAL